MSSISGPGPGGVGNAASRALEDQKDAKIDEEQSAEALKDINKKTSQLQKVQKQDNDAFQVKRDTGMVGTEDRAAAREKLEQQAMPDAIKIVESAMKTEVDAARLFKLQNKVAQDPAFKEASRELRVCVEIWQKQALEKLEKNPPKVEPLDLEKLKAFADKQAIKEPKKDEAPAKAENETKGATLRQQSEDQGAKATDLKQTQTQGQTKSDAATDDKAKTAAKDGEQRATAEKDAKASDAKATSEAKETPDLETKPKDAAKDAKPQDGAQAAKDKELAKDASATKDAKDTQEKDATSAQNTKDAQAQDKKQLDANKTAEKSGQSIASEENKARMQTQPGDEKLTPNEQAAFRMYTAMQDLKAGKANGGELTPEQKFLQQIMPPEDPNKFKEGELIVDQYGNELTEAEFADRAGVVMDKLGPPPELILQYNAMLFQLVQPIDVEVPTDGGSFRMGSGDDGGVTPTGGGFRLDSGGGGGGGSGGLRLDSGGGAGGVPNNPTITVPTDPVVIRADQAMSALDLLGSSYDITQYAMLMLMECLKDLNKDLNNKMLWAKVRHKMNDAMRTYMAEVFKKMAALTRPPADSNAVPEPIFIENLTPEMEIGPDGQPTGEVNMVPKEVETPISDQKAEDQEGITPETKTAASQVEEMRNKGLPIISERSENGTIFVNSTYSYVTVDHVGPMKERLRNEVQALKMDFEKEMLSVQKMMGLKKNVMDNLTKIIRTKSDEWAKSIALLKR